MRTLKRTLCLVLALVMVLGLGVTNAFALTADDFTDLKDAQHEEAIRVLTAIGVISGNGDGTLTPTATLTRGQMAVIITKLMGGLGNKFIPSSSFSDVKGHYAERYIAFCEAHNIVRGDIGAGGTYRPNDPVTGYQLGVMLLSVMGYNMDYEVKGKDWQAVTYKYVTKNSIDAGLSLEYDYDAAIPRDDAFQLCFNTLQATMVSYDSNSSVTGPGFEWTVTSDAKPVERTEKDDGTVKNYAGDNGAGFGTKQVCEEYYPKLTVVRADPDKADYARPGNIWKYGTAEVFVADTPIATFDGTFNGKDAKALEKKYGKDNITLYYNGVQDDKSFAATKAWIDDTTGINGFEIEVYEVKEGADTECRVIVREAYLATVGDATEAKGDKPASIELTWYIYDGEDVVTDTVDITEESDDYAVLSTCKKDDYVAVYTKSGHEDETPGDEWVYDIVKLTKTSGKVTLVTKGKYACTSFVTVDGVKYPIHDEGMMINKDTDKGKVDYAKYPTVGNSTLYLLGSTVLLINQKEDVATTTGYAYLYDSRKNNDNSSNWESEGGEKNKDSYLARLLLADGSLVEVPVYGDPADNANKGDKVRSDDSIVGSLVYYSVDKDGVYTLTSYISDVTRPIGGDAETDPITVTPAQYQVGAKSALEITRNKSQGKIPGEETQTPVYFDGKTVFFVVTAEEDEKAADGVNWKKTGEVYDIYTVPSFDTDADTILVTAVTAKKDAAGEATAEKEVADYVLILSLGDTASTLSGVYFIVNNDKAPVLKTYAENGEIIEYRELNAVVDGVRTTVKVEVTRDPKTGVVSSDVIGDGEVLLTSNPKMDNGIIVAPGKDLMDTNGEEPGNQPADGVIEITDGVSEVRNDHIKLNKNTDDYLVSKAVSVVFQYSVKDGSIKQITNIEGTINASYADKVTGGWAITDGKGNTVSALFLTQDVEE